MELMYVDEYIIAHQYINDLIDKITTFYKYSLNTNDIYT